MAGRGHFFLMLGTPLLALASLLSLPLAATQDEECQRDKMPMPTSAAEAEYNPGQAWKTAK